MKGLRKRRGQLNNSGFSLLELLVTVAIMSALSGMMVVGITILGSGDSKKVAKNIYSQVNVLRTNTMSVNADWYMTIESSTTGKTVSMTIYKKKSSDTDYSEYASYRFSTTRLTMNYECGGNTYEFKNGAKMYLKYSKNDGAFEKVVYTNEYGVETDMMGISGVIMGNFHIKGGTSKNEVTLWYKTGRLTTVN